MRILEKKLKSMHLPLNEDGSVLIVALIMLVLITLMGVSATTTTDIEIQIAGNDMIYKKNIYAAEGAAMEAIHLLAENNLETTTFNWLTTVEDSITDAEVRDDTRWDEAFSGDLTNVGSSSTSPNSNYIAIFDGMDEVQESLDVEKTRIFQYSVYGRSNQNNGVGIVKVGFRKAF